MRRCELQNLGAESLRVELLDGLQNVLPAGTPLSVQTSSSNLVDAYKWTELDARTGLATYALYSGISDRAEPCESLRASVVFSLGLESPTVLLSSLQLDDFRRGGNVVQEVGKRGIRGAYFVHSSMLLSSQEARCWRIVADVERTQGQVVDIVRQLADPVAAEASVAAAVATGCDELARIIAAADGFQSAAEESVTTHHYANVLFNVLRGGVFHDQYRVPVADFAGSVRHFNAPVFARHRDLLQRLPAQMPATDLLAAVRHAGDPQLERLCYEYLPITFGRRHGDPSRPWNRFAIRLKDAHGEPLLSYEGNWRDIFQNWEALAFSFPEFIESVVAKFVNASTVDGYNPYRITRDGIDWEAEEPDNPWSHIGYWGDHQIIYLLKLLELSRRFHPASLGELLHRPLFGYANVPYRIRDFAEIVADPKRTVDYDHALAGRIASRVAAMGADGKLVLDVARQRLPGQPAGEAAGALADQARQPRRRRRNLAQHTTTGVERREQRSGRARRFRGHAVLPAAIRQPAATVAGRVQRTCRIVSRGRPNGLEPRLSPLRTSARCWVTACSARTSAGARCRSSARQRLATGSPCTATSLFQGR